MDLILFGRQGSGKGTQAKKLVDEHGYQMFAMSTELKKVIKNGSPLGQKIKTTIDAGNLVADDLIMQIVETQLNSLPSSTPLIYDGIPRTLTQKNTFEEILNKQNRSALGLLFHISDETAKKRMLSRKICSQCNLPADPTKTLTHCEHCGGELITRADDTPEAIEKRLSLYTTETEPVIQWYTDHNRLITIDGTQSIPAVNTEVNQKITPYL